MLQHIKTWKKSILKFHFPVKLYEIRKNVMLQYYFLHKDLQIWIVTFFHKMHIFLFNLKKKYWNPKFNFLTIICVIRKKRKNTKLFVSKRSTSFVSHSLWKNIYFLFQFQKIRLIFKNSIFETKYMRYRENVQMKNYLPKWGLHILIKEFLDRMYILCFDF